MRCSVTGWIIVTHCALVLGMADAQSVNMIKGAPFRATKTVTVNRPGDQHTVSSIVARNSDGSIYEEMPDLRTGTPAYIVISDAPDMRSILLDVKRKLYSVNVFAPSLISNTQTPDQLQKQIDRLKTLKATHDSQDGYEVTTTPLGFRTQDGFVVFGTRRVYESLPPSSKLTEKIWETWWMPALSLNVEKTGIGADNKPASITKFTNVQAKEPDASLFEIPPDYLPSPPRTGP